MSVYVISSARTPGGSFLGAFSGVAATELGSVAIAACLERSKVSVEALDEVVMGQVVQAGCGQAPARQAALSAGIPQGVPCSTVNKVCGSGMQAVISAAQSIMAGDNELVVAGGMENMSKAPFLLPEFRQGNKFGSVDAKDSLQWDALRDVYSNLGMGNCAEKCVDKYSFSREEQDAYAIESFKRAQKAQADGIFKGEIAPVTVKKRKGEVVVDVDEGPASADFDRIPKLRPAFEKNGTITAANASSISDGAAALLLGGEKYKSKARFRIKAYASHAHEPTWFSTAPIEATRKCLQKAGLNTSDVGVFEINEAFAAVAMASIKELELDHSKVNIYGSGISLGHPIGCSGARIMVTLMTAMENLGVRYGLASLCIGGGEALAIILETVKD